VAEFEPTEVIERRRTRGPGPPWLRDNWWIWLAALVAVVVGLVLWFALGGDDDGSAGGDRTTMPALVGLQEDEAVRLVEEAELEPNVVGEQSDAPEGEVVSQDPGGGTQLAAGEEVTLSVSRGGGTTTVTQTETATRTETDTRTVTAEPETTPLPDVVGRDYVEATSAVVAAALVPQAFPVASSEAAGTVVAQNPRGGNDAERGSLVRLNVSRGAESDRGSTEVPDVTGPKVEDAVVAVAEASLTWRIVLRDAPTSEEVGEVIQQQPAPGRSVAGYTQITLFVGR
jgi:eukaryotic-like serine/threonine-protein kinase